MYLANLLWTKSFTHLQYWHWNGSVLNFLTHSAVSTEIYCSSSGIDSGLQIFITIIGMKNCCIPYLEGLVIQSNLLRYILSSMFHIDMLCQIFNWCKTFATTITFVKFLSVMYSFNVIFLMNRFMYRWMFFQFLVGCEVDITNWTIKWFDHLNIRQIYTIGSTSFSSMNWLFSW